MAATLLATERIAIDDRTIDQARHTPTLTGATLMLHTADGEVIELPDELQHVLLAALTSIANDDEIVIGRMPEELTSTVAADLLSVSRPTLMKWVRDGEIESFKVGTHTRFHRDEVLRMRTARAEKRRIAFDELRALDEANADALDD